MANREVLYRSLLTAVIIIFEVIASFIFKVFYREILDLNLELTALTLKFCVE